MMRISFSVLFGFTSMMCYSQIKEQPVRDVNTSNTSTRTQAGQTRTTKPHLNTAVPGPAVADYQGHAGLTVVKAIPSTTIKNQEKTGTCWSFSTTSLIESQALKNNLGQFDLSEMFTVRNIYIEKAKNYILRQGHTRFSEGALGHDQIRAVKFYGAIPEEHYSGRSEHFSSHDHSAMVNDLKAYLDTLIKNRPVSKNWLEGYNAILDRTMGEVPATFSYSNKVYTPLSFAREVLKFNADDYVNITSFTHQPYYTSYVLEVPDNFSNGQYYNVPLKDMMEILHSSVMKGYSVMWDADVSNGGFISKKSIALNLGGDVISINNDINSKELEWSAEKRQAAFESLTTEDDHLMHIVGLEKTADGKEFYNVKNSWGSRGPYNGYLKVSEAYMAMNTISLVIPKAALSKAFLDKLK